MKKTVVLIITTILLMVAYTPVHADIAPPYPPPGSGINPGQETRVQMVAENVLMVVRETSPDVYIIEVTADFAMKNLGNADEQMQVRFPLEDISGLGDGWGEHPEVRGFKASVDQSPVSTKTIQEPYQTNGIPLNWAVFDVNFPTGQDVHIRVSYITDVQDDAAASIHYILGTGAGWYQPIGTATITLRFPYAVSMANVIWFHEPDKIPENVVMIGKEIRWHWKNYEPSSHETISVAVVHPRDWQNILDLEARTGMDPGDIDLVIELSRKYQVAGNRKGLISTPRLGDLAEIAIEGALALHPNEIRLHLELAEIYFQRYRFWSYPREQDYLQKLKDEIDVILELDPTYQRALELKALLEEDLATAQSTTPATTPTKTAIAKTPAPKPSETPPPAVNPTSTPNAVTNGNIGAQVFAGLVVLIAGFIAGMVFTKKREESS